jgi:hypothetical protein
MGQETGEGVEMPEWLVQPWTSGETSDDGPALVALGDRLYLAWVGSGNDHLNIMPSVDLPNGVVGFDSSAKVVIDHLGADDVGSLGGPALAASPDGHVYMAWTHKGGGFFGGWGTENMFALAFTADLDYDSHYFLAWLDTSDDGPALTYWAQGNGLNIAWRGSGNEQLNTMQGIDLGSKYTSPDQTSPFRPALCTSTTPNFTLHMAWRGSTNNCLYRMSCDNTHPFVGEPPDPTTFEGKEPIRYDAATSPSAPAIESLGENLIVVWRGDNDHLYYLEDNLMGKGSYGPEGSAQLTEHHPAVARYRNKLYVAWTGTDDTLNVARIAP